MNLEGPHSQRYQALFLEDARDHLAGADAALAALAREPAGGSDAALRRSFHTLKGLAATVGCADLSRLAHDAEELCRPPLAPSLPATHLQALAQTCQVMGRYLAALENSQPPPALDDVGASLKAALASGSPRATAPMVETLPLPASVRVPLADLDALLAATADLELLAADEPGAIPSALEAELRRARGRRGLRDLRRRISRFRLVPFQRLVPLMERMVATAAASCGSQVRLQVHGAQQALDRSCLEALFEPLLHVLRNAVAHGIEPGGDRRSSGKTAVGQLEVIVLHPGHRVLVTVEDDGRGVDLERLQRLLGPGAPAMEELLRAGCDLAPYLCRPGLTTSLHASEIAGRGIGLDVVHSALLRVGGDLRITTRPGVGTRVELRLPATTALTRCLLARAGATLYGLPLSSVAAVGRAARAGGPATLRLEALLGGTSKGPSAPEGVCLDLLRPGAPPLAVRVDELLGQWDAVVRPLPAGLGRGLYLGSSLHASGVPVAVIDPLLWLSALPEITDACPASG